MRKLIVSIFCLAVAVSASAKDYYASMFGIKSNGTTLNTTSIQKAIDFISEEGGGKLIFKVGRYLTGTIELKDNVTIELGEDIYLVKIMIKTDDLDDVEKWLEGEEDAENEAVAGGSADASDAAGETLPDDNISQYGSGSDDD